MFLSFLSQLNFSHLIKSCKGLYYSLKENHVFIHSVSYSFNQHLMHVYYILCIWTEDIIINPAEFLPSIASQYGRCTAKRTSHYGPVITVKKYHRVVCCAEKRRVPWRHREEDPTPGCVRAGGLREDCSFLGLRLVICNLTRWSLWSLFACLLPCPNPE